MRLPVHHVDLDHVPRTSRDKDFGTVVVVLSEAIENNAVPTTQPKADLDVVFLSGVPNEIGSAAVSLIGAQQEGRVATYMLSAPVAALSDIDSFRMLKPHRSDHERIVRPHILGTTNLLSHAVRTSHLCSIRPL